MLSHAIAPDFYKDAAKPLNNFALTLPKPQGDLAAEMMKSELNLGFLHLKEGYAEADLEYALVNNLSRFLLERGKDFLLRGQQIEFTVGGESGKMFPGRTICWVQDSDFDFKYSFLLAIYTLLSR